MTGPQKPNGIFSREQLAGMRISAVIFGLFLLISVGLGLLLFDGMLRFIGAFTILALLCLLGIPFFLATIEEAVDSERGEH